MDSKEDVEVRDRLIEDSTQLSASLAALSPPRIFLFNRPAFPDWIPLGKVIKHSSEQPQKPSIADGDENTAPSGDGTSETNMVRTQIICQLLYPHITIMCTRNILTNVPYVRKDIGKQIELRGTRFSLLFINCAASRQLL